MLDVALVLIAACSWIGASFLSLAPRLEERWSRWLGVSGALVGSIGAAHGLMNGVPSRLDFFFWHGVARLETDALSAAFLLPLQLVAGLGVVYGKEYWPMNRPKGAGRSLRFHYGLLVAAMTCLLVARHGLLFLLAWEIMAVSAFLLIGTDHEIPEVRRASWVYLVCTHTGTAMLTAMVILLARRSGGLLWLPLPAGNSTLDAWILLLAILGFGFKAGFLPLHFWLPSAHAAAPSHVSAILSAVMLKTGIYGIARVLTFLGTPPSWWGWTLAAIGAVSGIVGVLFALAQHDIKRLLAYHSVENIGIICLGLGIGLLGVSYDVPAVAVLGFTGGLLHVLNHALFKGLLFLGAGAASASAGTREIDRLGGLLRRMPLTALAFAIGAAAICGLPPLNGFVSELLVFSGGLHAVSLPSIPLAAAGAAAMAALALISGLAAACFTKAFGISFLGEPRSTAAAGAREPVWSMVVPMLLLAAACAGVGILGWIAVSLLSPLAAELAGRAAADGPVLVAAARGGLEKVTLVAAAAAALALALTLLRALLLRGRAVGSAGTWDCGYVKPGARMQYTSSSFAQPLTAMFKGLLATRRKGRRIDTPFPEHAELSTETADAFAERIFLPGFRGIGGVFSRLRWLQHGRLQLYVLYIAAALVILLVWRLA